MTRSPAIISGPLLLGLFLICLCSLMWAEIVLYSQNTIYLNDNWIVSKRMARVGVFGGDEFLLARSPLAGNTLNLGTWHGFQEVVSRSRLFPERIEFRFRIPEDTYLNVTFGRAHHLLSGIRLSRKRNFPSIFYDGSSGGANLRATPLEGLNGLSANWHRASIVQTHTSDLELSIDNGPPIQIPGAHFTRGEIGFQGGGPSGSQLKVDDISVVTRDGNVVLETFRNRRGWMTASALNFGGVAGLAAFLCMLSARTFRPRFKQFLFHTMMISSVGLICGAAVFALDFFLWSHQPYFSIAQTLPSELKKLPENKVEAFRYNFFAGWARAIGVEAVSHHGVKKRGYPEKRIWTGPLYCASALRPCQLTSKRFDFQETRLTSGYRILFIGTSQTLGAGAENLEETFFVKIHRSLSKAVSPLPLESLNLSISGSNSHLLMENIRDNYLSFAPHLVVINLSTNDDPSTFEAGITAFLRENKSRGVRTVLLEEGSIVLNDRNLNEKHATLRKVAEMYQVSVLPLHEYLHDREVMATGILWWDNWHLTSHGQELVAKWLVPRLLTMIRRP